MKGLKSMNSSSEVDMNKLQYIKRKSFSKQKNLSHASKYNNMNIPITSFVQPSIFRGDANRMVYQVKSVIGSQMSESCYSDHNLSGLCGIAPKYGLNQLLLPGVGRPFGGLDSDQPSNFIHHISNQINSIGSSQGGGILKKMHIGSQIESCGSHIVEESKNEESSHKKRDSESLLAASQLVKGSDNPSPHQESGN